jgi:hypothetical protein
MIIKGFWHIYLVNHWYSIVVDQLRIMLNSSLYDACEEINIGCLGAEDQRALLQKLFIDQYPKLKIKYYSEEHAKYEFETLKLIEATPGDYAGFYFHTKAVTNPSDTIQNHWRAWLNEAILNRWEQHYLNVCSDVNNVAALIYIQQGGSIGNYEVSSVNHCMPPKHPEHFSGNFWWFSRHYINRLPKIDSLNKANRWQAEQWICRGRGKYYAQEFVEPGRDVFIMKKV